MRLVRETAMREGEGWKTCTKRGGEVQEYGVLTTYVKDLLSQREGHEVSV